MSGAENNAILLLVTDTANASMAHSRAKNLSQPDLEEIQMDKHSEPTFENQLWHARKLLAALQVIRELTKGRSHESRI